MNVKSIVMSEIVRQAINRYLNNKLPLLTSFDGKFFMSIFKNLESKQI